MPDSASLIAAAATLLVWGSATWVYWDATANGIGKIPGKKGFTNVSAGRWCWLSLLLWIIFFPLYLAKRKALIEIARTQPIEVKRRGLKLSILGIFTVLGVVGSLGGGEDQPQVAAKKPTVVAQKTPPKPAGAQPASAKPPVASAPQAGAAEEPEAVYRKFHDGLMARNFDELRKWGTKKEGDEMAAEPAVMRTTMLGAMAAMLPKSYTVAGKEVSPDGSKATLHLQASAEDKGKPGTVLATITLVKEGGAWKVLESNWGGDQGAPAASQAAAPKPAAPAVAAVAKAAPEVVKPAPVAAAVVAVSAPTMVAEAAPPLARPAAQASHRHSRAHEDARECLGRSTDIEIAACAENFR